MKKRITKLVDKKTAKSPFISRAEGAMIRKKHLQSKALAVVKKQPAPVTSPGLDLMKVDDVMVFAKTLKTYIVNNALSVKIEGHDYAKVDAWKFAALNFGLTGIPSPPVPMHTSGQSIIVMYSPFEFVSRNKEKYTKEIPVFMGFLQNIEALEYLKTSGQKITKEIHRPFYSYKCGCDVVKISDGTKVSFGEGMCSNLEESKIMSAEYAINSTAQTRAIGKALRNLLGFVMSSAGYQATPAEEMDEVKKQNEHFADAESAEGGSQLPVLTESQEQITIEKVRAGEWSVDDVMAHCTLSSLQLKALTLAEGKAKESKTGRWASA